METEKGDSPKSQFKSEVGVMGWNDASKTKSVKFVSMVFTIHTFEMVGSNKIDRSTGAVIKMPVVIMNYNVTMGGVDLVSRVLILYSSQKRGVKWYRKIAEFYLDISVYNSFILWKKMNPDKQSVDHLRYRKMLIEEIIMFHAFCGQSQSTGPYPDTTKANLIRLTERHFISQLPSTNNKARAQRKCIRCTKLGFRKNTRFWCVTCRVAFCFNECFEVYHTKRDIKKSLHEDLSDSK